MRPDLFAIIVAWMAACIVGAALIIGVLLAFGRIVEILGG